MPTPAEQYRTLVARLEAIQEGPEPTAPTGGLPSDNSQNPSMMAQHKKNTQWDPLIMYGQSILKDPKASTNVKVGSMFGYLKMIQLMGISDTQLDQGLKSLEPLLTKNKEAWKAANETAQKIKPVTDGMRINYADGFNGANGLGKEFAKDLMAQYGQWLASPPALEEPKPFNLNPFK